MMAIKKRWTKNTPYKVRRTIFFTDENAKIFGDISSPAVNTVVERYFSLLQLESIGDLFNEHEMAALRNWFRGPMDVPANELAGSLMRGWSEKDAQHIAIQFNIDHGNLLSKLSSLSQLQELSLIEKIEAWWRYKELQDAGFPNVSALGDAT